MRFVLFHRFRKTIHSLHRRSFRKVSVHGRRQRYCGTLSRVVYRSFETHIFPAQVFFPRRTDHMILEYSFMAGANFRFYRRFIGRRSYTRHKSGTPRWRTLFRTNVFRAGIRTKFIFSHLQGISENCTRDIVNVSVTRVLKFYCQRWKRWRAFWFIFIFNFSESYIRDCRFKVPNGFCTKNAKRVVISVAAEKK